MSSTVSQTSHKVTHLTTLVANQCDAWKNLKIFFFWLIENKNSRQDL